MAQVRPEDEVEDEVEEDEEDDEEQEDDGADNGEKKTDDIRNKDVVTKYRLAADIANEALRKVLAAAVPGAKVVDLCETGDKYINEATSKVYNKGNISKGVGFPTCVSVNNIVGSFSPMPSDPSIIKEGDMVKVDLGVQIDGYVSQVAYTIVVNGGQPITGRQADVMAAAFTAAQCALRMLKPGTKNTDVTRVIEKVAKEYKCNPVEGVFSHQVQRFEIDAEKVVANSIPDVPLTGDHKTKECKFEEHEVWGLDIVMSTGSGKPQPVDDKNTTVYKRMVDQNYKLKMKASRAVLSEINEKFPTFPFSIRALQYDEKKLRFGVVNCVQHSLLEPYPVLFEKDGEFVAHVKFTALLLPNGTLRITDGNYDLSNVRSDLSVQDAQIKEILASALPSKKKKKANKKKKKKSKAAKPAAEPAAATPAKTQ